MGKLNKYKEKWIDCSCGNRLCGTYKKWMGYIFTCSKCYKVYRGGFWIRTWWWLFLHYRDSEGKRL